MAKITIYSTTTCPYCIMLKNYLKSKNIGYEEVLLDKNPEQGQASIDTCGSMGVPCTHIVKDDGAAISILGFDKEKIDTALGIK
ncbi:NrdH-redoxin [Candidatus Roizmanbacteria bacterium CG_4_10_14_0_8_um_filter_39_9]|uniref:NrdH-redoxin n=1 Tax=Candidatus Roizmanbacteria bacterium CG_4_10_14_0_8_um_filter_39_9 TaxID=1974829 RepID=A0A2M7QEU6_9BACT|nr:MAG: NrdH-redoxin [Candidatus Roizmanbacteria bacterium CG_4_10_14_0_8_um_filter_39_9]